MHPEKIECERMELALPEIISLKAILQSFKEGIALLFKDNVRVPGRDSKHFRKYIKKTYEEITKIHVDYGMIFIAAQARIKELDIKNQRDADPKDTNEILKLVVDELLEKRKGYEQVRNEFRLNLSSRLAMVDNKLYQYFFLSVFDYFIVDDDKGHFVNDISREMELNLILQRSGRTGRRSPSSEAINEIVKCENYEAAQKQLQKIIDSINRKKFNIDLCYKNADDLTSVT